MSFLQPLLLWGIPLAALPVAIHLIHLYRRRTVPWAAMMFLRAAQRMNKGFSRLRQLLILAFRVLALLALILVVSRPLAGGWLGLTGGAPDTILVLVDRSASMEQQNPVSGTSKRAAGLRSLAKAIADTVGTRSRLLLIDSAELRPLPLERADALPDLPQTEATDTAADVPAMLQAALDHISRNRTGRTDVWLLSDLQAADWDAAGGRWEALRAAFSALPGVRFRLLCYPEVARDNLGVSVERVVRREVSGKAELLLDIRVVRRLSGPLAPAEIPLRVVVNGAGSALRVAIREDQVLLQAQSVPIDRATRRGWGRVELPGDACPADNVFHFAFDDPPALRSVIVSDDESQAGPLRAALSAPADPSRKYAIDVVGAAHAAAIPWEESALVVWHAPLPDADDPLARLLEHHVGAGRCALFLPPENPGAGTIFGLRWGGWKRGGERSGAVKWWRNDAGLLANTREGRALPVGELEVLRRCEILGDGVPLARLEGDEPLLVRSAAERGGGAYFLGTLPGPGASSLARDGVVFFAMLHRALNEAALGLGRTRQRSCAPGVLGGDAAEWRAAGVSRTVEAPTGRRLEFRAGIRESGDRLLALNRPAGEDQTQTVGRAVLDGLFRGLDCEVVEESLEADRSLTSEVWRTFLVAMALFLVGEALLCLPSKHGNLPAAEPKAPVSPR